jgi:hypothetical protein
MDLCLIGIYFCLEYCGMLAKVVQLELKKILAHKSSS